MDKFSEALVKHFPYLPSILNQLDFFENNYKMDIKNKNVIVSPLKSIETEKIMKDQMQEYELLKKKF